MCVICYNASMMIKLRRARLIQAAALRSPKKTEKKRSRKSANEILRTGNAQSGTTSLARLWKRVYQLGENYCLQSIGDKSFDNISKLRKFKHDKWFVPNHLSKDPKRNWRKLFGGKGLVIIKNHQLLSRYREEKFFLAKQSKKN